MYSNKEDIFLLIKEQIYYSYKDPCDFNKIVRPVLEKIAKMPDGLEMLNKVTEKENEILNIYREISQLNQAGLSPDDYDIVPYNKNFKNIENSVPLYNYDNPIFVPQIEIKSSGILKLLQKSPSLKMEYNGILTAYQIRIKKTDLRRDYEKKIALNSDVLKMKEQQGEGKYNRYIIDNLNDIVDKRILKDIAKPFMTKMTDYENAVIRELDHAYLYKDRTTGEIKLEYVDNQMNQQFYTDIQHTNSSIRKNNISLKKAKLGMMR